MAKRLPSIPPILPGLTYIRPLGSGGFADVFLYEQDMPRRQVAVKVLPSDARDADLIRMFNAEADVLAHLSAHPSIVTVYQAGISAEGRPYIVMENCPGSLAQRYRVERIPVAEVLVIGVRMASALESAHRAGLIHRDVKPSNILVTTFGAPVLADFGISSSLTRIAGSEVLAMSIPWSAPEVVAEETAGSVASEIWSLGATLYSLLAGRSPFERREAGQNTRDHLRRRIARATYTPIERADVPESLQRVLAGAMTRDPKGRFASARDLAVALQSVQQELGLATTPLEVPTEDWTAGAAAIDFSDTTVRGAPRTAVDGVERRRTRARTDLAHLAREEDTQFAPRERDRDRYGDRDARPRRVGLWIGAGVGTAAAATAAIVVALHATGVL